MFRGREKRLEKLEVEEEVFIERIMEERRRGCIE